MNLKGLFLAAIAMAAFAAPAPAHHSFAMFDQQKTVEIQGTVTEFEWIAPHAWIRLNVPDAQGKMLPWAIEMSPPVIAAGNGWKADSLKPGDKVVLQIHPMRDGSRSGQLLEATLPDGTGITRTRNTRVPATP